MGNQDSQYLKYIKPALAYHFPDCKYYISTDNFVSTPFRMPRKHQLYRAVINKKGSTDEVYIKFFEKTEKANAEYNTLVHCWAHLPPNFSVPKPIAFLDEINAVMIAKCDGIPLNKILTNAFFFHQFSNNGIEIFDFFERIGKWLRLFHETFDTNTYINSDQVLDQLSTSLRNVKYRIDEDKIYNYAEECSKEMDEIKVSLLHFHLNPSHVFISREKISVIDFERTRNGPVYFDLLSFLASIESKFRIFNIPTSQVTRSFLKGYFGDEPINTHAIELFKMYYLVSKLTNPLPRNLESSLSHRVFMCMEVKAAFKEIKKMIS